MTTVKQVLCNWQGEEIYGGATCPFCGVRTVLSTYQKKLYADPVLRCQHTDMAVDAGSMQIAISFVDR